MARLLQTAFRVTIDFSITISDDDARPFVEGATGYVERERRLLLALLQQDRDLLTAFLKKYVLAEMATIDMDEVETRIFGRKVNEQALLAPVINTMSAADADFFASARMRGAYAVETERFSECIKVDLEEVALTERRVADGQPRLMKSARKA